MSNDQSLDFKGMPPPGPPPILGLPLEISQQAIILVAPNDMAALAQSCRSFRTIIYSDDSTHLWSSVFLGLFDDPRIRTFLEKRGGWYIGTCTQIDSAIKEIEYDWRSELQRRLRAKKLINSKTRASSATSEERQAALSALLSVVHTSIPYTKDVGGTLYESKNMPWVISVLEGANAMNHTMWPSLRHAIFHSQDQFPTNEERDLRSELHTLVGLTAADRLTVLPPSQRSGEDGSTYHPAFDGASPDSTMATFVNHSLQDGVSLNDWSHHDSPFGGSRYNLRSHSTAVSASPSSWLSRRNLRTDARSYVYDLRAYSRSNLWGPLLPDPEQYELSCGHTRHKESYIARWRLLECLMMVVTWNIEEERLTVQGGGLTFLFQTPSPPVDPDSLRPWSAPGFKNQLEDAAERERLGTEGSLGEEDGHWKDWAGVEGKWKRIICFMDYRDLARYNFNPVMRDGNRDTSLFEEEDFHEAVRCLNVDIRIVDTDPNPPAYCKTRPKIEFVGHSEFVDGEDHARQLRGSVECLPSGVIKWNLVSIWDGEERWTSEGVQIGGVGSARGVMGNWSGAEHNPGDPIGPFWFWKIAGRDALRPLSGMKGKTYELLQTRRPR